MADDVLKLAMVGCGAPLWMYASVLKYMKCCKFVVAMDPQREAAEKFAGHTPGCKVYTEYEDVLRNKDVDAVVIASPSWYHEEQAVQAAAAGKHVLCEKPLAPSTEACDRMINACEKAGVRITVLHMKRFNKAFRKVRWLIEQGHLGKVFMMRSEWDEPSQFVIHHNRTRSDAMAMGGHFQDHGPHTVDLARWWLGEVEAVSGVIRMVNPKMPVEDLAVATLEHENGAISVHQTTVYTFRQWFERYQLFGSEGTLVVHGDRHTSSTLEAPKMTLHKGPVHHIGEAGVELEYSNQMDVTPYNAPVIDEEITANHQYLREFETFSECILQDKPFPVTVHDSRQTIAVVEALYYSAFHDKKVRLPIQHKIDLAEIFSQLGQEKLRFKM